MASWGALCVGRRKYLGLFRTWFCTIGSWHAKVVSYKQNGQLKLNSLTLKTRGEGKSSQCQHIEHCPCLSTLLVRRDVQKYKSTLVYGPWLILGWTSRDLKGTWLKNWCQRDPEKKQVDRAFQMGKACEDIYFYVNAHWRVNSTEKYFNNQMEKMSHSVGLSQPTSPATLSLLSWLMNKVTMAAEMKVLHGLIVICLPGTSWLWLL